MECLHALAVNDVRQMRNDVSHLVEHEHRRTSGGVQHAHSVNAACVDGSVYQGESTRTRFTCHTWVGTYVIVGGVRLARNVPLLIPQRKDCHVFTHAFSRAAVHGSVRCCPLRRSDQPHCPSVDGERHLRTIGSHTIGPRAVRAIGSGGVLRTAGSVTRLPRVRSCFGLRRRTLVDGCSVCSCQRGAFTRCAT